MVESGPEGVALSPAVLVCCFQGAEESTRPPNSTLRGGREAWFSHVTAATGGTVVRAVTGDPESSVLTLPFPPLVSAVLRPNVRNIFPLGHT